MFRRIMLIVVVVALVLAAILAVREARRHIAQATIGPQVNVSYHRIEVFAPEPGGVVKEILIPDFDERMRSGSPLLVKAGDPLLRLENKGLDEQWHELQTRLTENQERQRSLLNQEQATRSPLEQKRIRNGIASLRAVELLLCEEGRIVAQMREDLVITSPMDGQIEADGLYELKRRQVEPGELLFEIIDTPGDESNERDTRGDLHDLIDPAPDLFLLSSIHLLEDSSCPNSPWHWPL